MKKIKFDVAEEHLPGIEPIKNFIPKWWRDAERYVGGKPILSPSNNAMKLCMPFFDSFTQGYAIPLICDAIYSVFDGILMASITRKGI
jgi:hypothetical protein